MQRPFTLVYDPARGLLTFRELFPNVGARSAIVAALREVVAARSTREVPAYKRLDGRRAQARCAVRGNAFSLTLHVRGRADERRPAARHARRRKSVGRSIPGRRASAGNPGSNDVYAVQQMLNLVNELFLVLHEKYPDYLIAHFGLSSE